MGHGPWPQRVCESQEMNLEHIIYSVVGGRLAEQVDIARYDMDLLSGPAEAPAKTNIVSSGRLGE